MNNADINELHKFSALENDWWDENGKCQPLHRINPLRLSFIQQYLDLRDKAVLDIGCGGGILAESMAKSGANVTGIDLAEGALNAAISHRDQANLQINYALISAEAFAENHEGQFDVITCMEMLEHVPDPISIIQACSKLIKPQGHIFFSTINRNIKAYIYAIIGAEWLLQLLPKGTHDFAKFIRPSELSAWASAVNLSVKELKGIMYQPLTKQYQLSPDVSVNYLMACEKSHDE